jgi:hypothetical protein
VISFHCESLIGEDLLEAIFPVQFGALRYTRHVPSIAPTEESEYRRAHLPTVILMVENNGVIPIGDSGSRWATTGEDANMNLAAIRRVTAR